MLICALGDLLLDVIVLTEGAESDSEGSAQTRAGAGGQSANVAAWSVELGADARFVGKRAADAAGGIVAAELAGRGVDVVGPVAEGRNGVVVSLVDGEGRRTMLTDRGVAPELRAEELEMAWFRGCDVAPPLRLFALPQPDRRGSREGGRRGAGARAAGSASTSRARPGSRPCASVPEATELLQPDILFGNESELAALGAHPPARSVVVKRGAARLHGRRAGGARHSRRRSWIRPEPAMRWLQGSSSAGPELAAEAAARCVAKLGAMP